MSPINDTVSDPASRHVSFNPDLDCCEPTVVDYFEQADVWFTATELKTIRKRCRAIVQKLMAYPSLQPKLIESRMCESMSESLRGLEVYTAKNQRAMQKRQRAARQAVMEEQAMQQSLGVSYPEAIAMTYAAECQESIDLAQTAGAEDSRQALNRENDTSMYDISKSRKQREKPATKILGQQTTGRRVTITEEEMGTNDLHIQRKIANPAA